MFLLSLLLLLPSSSSFLFSLYSPYFTSSPSTFYIPSLLLFHLILPSLPTIPSAPSNPAVNCEILNLSDPG
jgi:hypothetical protein